MWNPNKAHRVVLVVAFGAFVVTVGQFVTSSEFAYAWTGVAPFHGPRPPWAALFVWLALTAVWAAGSLFLLRTGRPSTPTDDTSPDPD